MTRGGLVRGCRSDSSLVQVGTHVVERLDHGITVIAALAARETAAASPRYFGVLLVHAYVPARHQPRQTHLAPRRDRLARLGVGDRASGATELRAVTAGLERGPSLGEHRQS